MVRQRILTTAALLCAAAGLVSAHDPAADGKPPQDWFAHGGGPWLPSAGWPPSVASEGGIGVFPHLGKDAEINDPWIGGPILFVGAGSQTKPSEPAREDAPIVPGRGSISSRGILATGTGTRFFSAVRPGDRLMAGGQTVTVEQVVGDTALIVSPGFDPDIKDADWSHTDSHPIPDARPVSGCADPSIIWALVPTAPPPCRGDSPEQ